MLSFAQNRGEMPLALDIHPSGFFVATGTEDFATEHAVTNSKLEALRRIPMKMALEKAVRREREGDSERDGGVI